MAWPLLQKTFKWRKMNGPQQVVEHPRGPNHGDLSEEIATMADSSQYNESARLGKTEQPANTWKPIGDLARALVEGAAKK